MKKISFLIFILLLSSCSGLENTDVESASSGNTSSNQSGFETEIETNAEEASNEPILYCKGNIVESCFEENGFTLNQLGEIKEYYKLEKPSNGGDIAYHTAYLLEGKNLYFISQAAALITGKGEFLLGTKIHVISPSEDYISIGYGYYKQPIFDSVITDKLIVPKDLSYIGTMEGDTLIGKVWESNNDLVKDIELNDNVVTYIQGKDKMYGIDFTINEMQSDIQIKGNIIPNSVDKIKVSFSNYDSVFPDDEYELQGYKKGDKEFKYNALRKYEVLDYGKNTYLIEGYSNNVLVASAEMIIDVEKILKAKSNEYNSFIQSGDAKVKDGYYSDAIELYKKAIEEHKLDAKPFNNIGWLLEQEGKTEEAISYYKQAYSLDKNHKNALANLISASWSTGSISFNNGDYENAIKNYKAVIPYILEEEGELYNLYNNIGAAYSAKGEHNQAIVYFNKSILLDPSLSDGYTNKGRAFLYLEDMTQAKVNIDKALQLNQQDDEALKLLNIINNNLNTTTYPTSSSSNSFSSNSYSRSSSSSDYDDGYEWAEDNDIDDFDDCDDEFGSGYGGAEDGCNKYVQENHYSFDTTFGSYECTEDCSGHEAGYEWAEENWIDDEGDCDNWSNSFEEGCLEYVNE